MAEELYIDQIILVSPPFNLGEIVDEVVPTPVFDTDVEDELVLETPTLLVSGLRIGENGRTTRYRSNAVQVGIIEESNRVFKTREILKFLGDITISFTSIYPLKTYSDTFKRTDVFVGEPEFNYQFDSAEIRYSIRGRSPNQKGKTYKENIILQQNTTGSDNVVFNYKLYYKGKSSDTGQIEFNIIKRNSDFYQY